MTIMDFIKHIPAVAIGLWVVDHVFGQPDRPPLEFHVDNAAEHYKEFIENLREQLGSGNTARGIRILRNPATVPNNRRDRYLLVHLSNEDNFQITVALDVTNAYVIGYRAGNRSYFFNEYYDSARSVIFTDAVPHRIPFESNYDDVEHDMVVGAQNRARERERERAANQAANQAANRPANRARNRAGSSSQQIINRPSTSRATINLGLAPLQAAIAGLFRYDRENLAQHMLVIIQTISEAARYTYIERCVVRSIQNHESFQASNCMRSLENNWSALSRGFQNCNSSGEFPASDQRQLTALDGRPYLARSVSHTILTEFGLALLKYSPRRHREL